MQQTRLYVGNLPFSTTEDELSDAFGQFGQVTNVYIVTDRDTGRARGFAFVEFASSDEANAAIEGLDNQDFGGRTLRVNHAREREQRRGGGGGGGGGGGYRGGGGGGYRF